jgi:hypothetical protein
VAARCDQLFIPAFDTGVGIQIVGFYRKVGQVSTIRSDDRFRREERNDENQRAKRLEGQG